MNTSKRARPHHRQPLRAPADSLIRVWRPRTCLNALLCALLAFLGMASVANAPPASAAPWAVIPLSATLTPTQLAQTIAGPGVAVSAVTYTGAVDAAGTFSDPSGAVGLTSGVVLSTGKAVQVAGPNDATGNGASNGTGGDAGLDLIVAPRTTSDAAILQFTVVPTAPQLSISYTFASEEYEEYVGSSFNDVFAFFVNGTNCAVVPGTSDPVTINTIHRATTSPLVVPERNSAFYVPNRGAGSLNRDTQFDGLTIPLTCRATVTAGVPATIKLAIADTADSSLDSAVFLQAGGVTSTAIGACSNVTPARVIDTRQPATLRLITPASPLEVTVAGQFGVPANAASVFLNVTADGSTGVGYLIVYPSGIAPPPTSNVNFEPSKASSNSATVKLGAGGKIVVAAGAASAYVIIDVTGWCGPSGVDRLLPISPVRLRDTRNPAAPGVPQVQPGTPLEVQVTGAPGIPTTGVTTAVLNVTAIDASGGGYLTVYPANIALPATSSVNYANNKAVPNTIFAPLSPDGKVKIYTFRPANIIVDVMGWLGPAGVQEISLLTPVRIFDSRLASFNPGTPKLGSTPRDLQVTTSGGVPAIARGVVLNVTATGADSDGFLTVWPADKPAPATSNVNYSTNQDIPNTVVVGLSPDGKIKISSFANTHVIVDVVGWFA